MVKALRVFLIAYGALGILTGLAFILVPGQFTQTFGFPAVTDYISVLTSKIGFSYIAVCIFIIIGARNPIKHIVLVKLAIVFALFLLVQAIYTWSMGYLTFNQAAIDIVIHGVFAAAFLIFYPWHAAQAPTWSQQ
jgi:hypothetical protein